jgi:diguanylate cyclase (GGDEF)-like protein
LVILELLKDISDSLISDNKPLKSISEVQQLLKYTKSLVFKDALTGLYNRRYIDETLPTDILFATNTKQNLCVIMADIDWFKNVNDTYGHLAGDEVLRIFGQTLEHALRRDTDWAARYGGEEFIISLPGAKPHKAAEFAEIMRKEIEDTVIPYGSNQIKITASFGVCGIDEVETKDMKNLVECADRKLYLAKQKGRNRVEA